MSGREKLRDMENFQIRRAEPGMAGLQPSLRVESAPDDRRMNGGRSLKKNDLLEIKIEAMGNAGEGIGKIDGYPLFVKDALPGDTAGCG